MLLRAALITAAALSGCARPSSSDDVATDKYPVFQGKEGVKYHTGLLQKPKAMRGLGETHTLLADCGDLPETFDLRTLGTVPPIKDQGQCGS